MVKFNKTITKQGLVWRSGTCSASEGKINAVKVTLDVLGFGLIFGGSVLVRYSAAEQISIVGGILVSIGVGLLALARTL